MTTGHPIIQDAVPGTWVAIDIAKDSHAVLLEHGGRRERFRLANEVCFVSSLSCARYREARNASWDKNDPKDARVILGVLQQGTTIR